jgi:hypothetical protein
MDRNRAVTSANTVDCVVRKAPPSIRVSPVYVLVPESVNIPVPVFVTADVLFGLLPVLPSAITPANSVDVLSEPICQID